MASESLIIGHRFRLLEAMPDGVLLTRADGTIAYTNAKAGQMFGYTQEELTGLTLDALLPERFRQIHRKHQARYFSNPAVRPMGSGRDLTALCKDGRELAVEISLSPFESAEGLLVACSIRDVTQRKRSERRLREALSENQQLRDRLQQENVYLQEEIKSSHDFEEIVGQSEGIRAAIRKTKLVAETDATVLLLGETGTGKELFARAVHHASPRKAHPLVKVNCGALPASLIESELFGHVEGAFTGAISDRIGRFQLADGGAIFLDEIGELPLELQAKLLHVLQEGEFERIGSAQTIKVDVRVIAATNRDLQAAMRAGEFRLDLYYRLAVFPIEIPPLRQHRQDIPLLTWRLITRKYKELGKNIRDVSERTMATLVEYDWPGNVRELENVVERAMILSPGPSLKLDGALAELAPAAGLDESSSKLADVDRDHIVRVLRKCDWRVKGTGNTADRLGLKPSTLRYRMKKLGIQRPPR